MESELSLHPQLLWQPKDPDATQLEKFRLACNKKFSLSLTNYHDLYVWSCENLKEFWSTVWEYTGIVSSQSYTQVNYVYRMDEVIGDAN